jgi:hypothetical protein
MMGRRLDSASKTQAYVTTQEKEGERRAGTLLCVLFVLFLFPFVLFVLRPDLVLDFLRL